MNQLLKSTNWIVDISGQSVVLVKGVDAVKFLQGQVTCDIKALLCSANQRPSALGAHCTNKGRMLFTFRAFCIDNNTIALVVYRELIPHIMQSLGKYIIFSKAELIDARIDYQLLGIQGEAATAVLKEYIPQLNDTVTTVSLSNSIIAICLGGQRYEVLFSSKSNSDKLSSEELLNQTARCRNSLYAVCKAAEMDYWTLENIRSGIGEVRPETVEEFIPQMLNLQAVGNGISFNKGCYTGQEIVARMQYRGKLKRQMHRLQSETGIWPKSGDPIYSLFTDEPVGTVVIASRREDYTEMLAVVVNTAVEENTAYLDKDHQYKLQLLTLPYPIS